MAKINERKKILTVTDCYGRETAQAYLANPIASDSEDEKKIEKARKEAKANKEEKRRAVKSKRRENPSSKRPFHGSNAWGSLPAGHHSQSPTCWRCVIIYYILKILETFTSCTPFQRGAEG